jgi:hypothetical protein
MIHTTIGLYANGEKKYNGVANEDLQYHIEYNKKWRFGRALIVDGECVYEGVVSKDIIDKAVAEQKANPVKFNEPTIPYQ